MSLKSTIMTVAAMAMVGAQNPDNLYAFGNGYPASKPAPKKKSEQKKCKSCRKFEKGEHRASCPKKSYCDPLAAACSDYEPKRQR